MKITELLDLVQNKISENVNQSMIAKALGVTRQTISNRIRNNSEITISELEKIQDFFNVKLISDAPVSDGMVQVDYYPEVFASCGNGTVTFSDEKELVEFHKSMLPDYYKSKKYSMICARGDSMSPYINSGDKLIIEHWENNQIIDNKVYVFSYKSEIFVKRLSKNLDEIIIKSDNPNYNIRVIKGEDMNDINIIGRVVSVLRSI